MKKDNDFGLKDIDLRNRKLSKNKKPFVFMIFLIVLAAIYFLNQKDLYTFNLSEISEYNDNDTGIIDSFEIKKLINKNKILSDTLISEKEFSSKQIKSDNVSIRFNKEIVELDSLTGNYFIIEGSFSNYNLSLNRAKYLSKNGFQPIIIFPKNNNMHRVAVDMYIDLDYAKESLEAYKNKLNNKLWILRH